MVTLQLPIYPSIVVAERTNLPRKYRIPCADGTIRQMFMEVFKELVEGKTRQVLMEV